MSSLVGMVMALVFVSMATSDDVSVEKRLLQTLLSDYNKDIRPAPRHVPVKLSLGMKLVRLHTLDVEQEALQLHAWINMVWKDSSLRWNASDNGGIDSLMISNKHVWLPDIKLYNSIEAEHGIMDAKVVVSSDGSILYIPRVSLHSHCSIKKSSGGVVDTEQNCHLKFGSWVYDGNLVELEHYAGVSDVDMAGYNPHPEWSIVEATGTKHVLYYDCCPEPYPDITYYIRLRKNDVSNSTDGETARPLSVGDKPINQVIVGMSLVLLIPTVFLLPPESREKVTLGVGVLIALTVMRASSGVSTKLAVLLEVNFLLVSISLVCSAVVLNMWYNSSPFKEVSTRIRQLVFGVAAFCCLGGDPTKQPRAAEMASLNGVEHGALNNNTLKNPNGEWQTTAKVIDRALCVVFFMLTLICGIGSLG